MKRLSVSIMALFALIALSAPRAEATALVPGGTAVPATVLTGFGGTELDSVFYDDVVSETESFIVDMASAVYMSAGGTLDFYYQLSSSTASVDDIRRLSTSIFTGFTTDVYQILLGTSVGCSACGGTFLDGTQDAALADRSPNGSVVGFLFQPSGATALNPGETSLLFVIRTDATAYVPGLMSVIDGSIAQRPAFQPAVAVPEPASMMLMGLGFLGTGWVARRRKQSALKTL